LLARSFGKGLRSENERAAKGKCLMKKRALVIFAVVLSLGGDTRKDDAAQQERDKLKGTWMAVSYEWEGTKLDEKDFKDLRLVIQGKRFAFLRRGHEKAAAKGTFRIDPTKKPKTIDLTYDAEPGLEEWKVTVFGIYELDADTLKLCIGKKRPMEFKTTPDDKRSLASYKRQTP
jgi:uncharacterized protein (TIGR03067 family)